jgi:glycine C-acetyltransferase
MLTQSTELRDRLEANTQFFRAGITQAGFNIVPGAHPIVPILLGDATLATQMADRLLEKGVYVIGFAYPVVPPGKATQDRRDFTFLWKMS